MNDFLNPKSMLTPGIAGSVTMFIVNGLAIPFPDLPSRYVALALSFALGALALHAAKMTLIERVAYWFVNSLIIFVVGFGTNHLARQASSSSAEVAAAQAFSYLVRPALADEGASPPAGARQ